MGLVKSASTDFIEPIEAAANRVLAEAFPRIEGLVDRTVDQVEIRANVLVDKTLATTFAYVDQTVAAAQTRLEASIESAGAELRNTSTHAVEQLEAAVERRIGHLENQSVRTLEEAVRRSVEESAKTTRMEIDAVLRSLQRLLLGLAVPVPSAVYAALAAVKGVPSGELGRRSVAVLAATTFATTMVETLRRSKAESGRFRWFDVLLDLAPFVVVGAVFVVAVALVR